MVRHVLEMNPSATFSSCLSFAFGARIWNIGIVDVKECFFWVKTRAEASAPCRESVTQEMRNRWSTIFQNVFLNSWSESWVYMLPPFKLLREWWAYMMLPSYKLLWEWWAYMILPSFKLLREWWAYMMLPPFKLLGEWWAYMMLPSYKLLRERWAYMMLPSFKLLREWWAYMMLPSFKLLREWWAYMMLPSFKLLREWWAYMMLSSFRQELEWWVSCKGQGKISSLNRWKFITFREQWATKDKVRRELFSFYFLLFVFSV